METVLGMTPGKRFSAGRESVEKRGKIMKYKDTLFDNNLVEAAGVEPASENHHPRLLHAYPEL